MFEVNFFEKKQKNVLPYILSGIFFFLFVLLGIYFFSMQLYYNNAEVRNQEWLQMEEEELKISRQMQEYDQLTQQVGDNKVAFETMQYPMAYVSKTILENIPNAEKHVSIFNKNETNQLTLVLEDLTPAEVSATVEKIKTVPFISTVHFIRMENQTDGVGSVVELWLEIDETALEEVNQS